MTPKQIMAMPADARLALEARARAGDVEAVADWMLLAAWRAVSAMKNLRPRQRVRSFIGLCQNVAITVETTHG